MDSHKGGKKSILDRQHFDFIDQKMESNNELTALELRDMIKENIETKIGRRSVQRVRSKLILKFKKTLYCQLISEKICHLEW